MPAEPRGADGLDLEHVQRAHVDGINHAISVWGPWCYLCQAEYPCLPARLAAEIARLRAALLAAHNAFDDLIQPICRYTDMDDPPPALAAVEARDACEVALSTKGAGGEASQ